MEPHHHQTERMTREECEREATIWQRISMLDYMGSQASPQLVTFHAIHHWQSFQRQSSAIARHYLFAAIDKKAVDA